MAFRIIAQKVLEPPLNDGRYYTYIEAYCESTDEKPTELIANGSIFIEVDTGKGYFFNEESGEWLQKFSVSGSSGGEEPTSTSVSLNASTQAKTYYPSDFGDFDYFSAVRLAAVSFSDPNLDGHVTVTGLQLEATGG